MPRGLQLRGCPWGHPGIGGLRGMGGRSWRLPGQGKGDDCPGWGEQEGFAEEFWGAGEERQDVIGVLLGPPEGRQRIWGGKAEQGNFSGVPEFEGQSKVGGVQGHFGTPRGGCEGLGGTEHPLEGGTVPGLPPQPL